MKQYHWILGFVGFVGLVAFTACAPNDVLPNQVVSKKLVQFFKRPIHQYETLRYQRWIPQRW